MILSVLLTILFAGLKLTGRINWSWDFVLLPGVVIIIAKQIFKTFF